MSSLAAHQSDETIDPTTDESILEDASVDDIFIDGCEDNLLFAVNAL